MQFISYHSNREELVKIIGQLKSGEDVLPIVPSNAKEEDSSSAEILPQEEATEVRKLINLYMTLLTSPNQNVAITFVCHF